MTTTGVTVSTIKDLSRGYQESLIGIAVIKNDPIELTHFDEDLNILTTPFAADDRLWRIAENQAIKRNTFILDGDDTWVEWLSPDIGQTHYPWPKPAGTVRGFAQTVSDGSKLTPHLFSFTKEPISRDTREVRHLEVHFSIVATGFDVTEDPMLTDRVKDVLASIPAAFPRLRSLNVVVFNTGVVHCKAKYTCAGAPLLSSKEQAIKSERTGKAKRFVESVAALKLKSPRLFQKASKALTFVHRMEGGVVEEVKYWPGLGERLSRGLEDSRRRCDRVKIVF